MTKPPPYSGRPVIRSKSGNAAAAGRKRSSSSSSHSCRNLRPFSVVCVIVAFLAAMHYLFIIQEQRENFGYILEYEVDHNVERIPDFALLGEETEAPSSGSDWEERMQEADRDRADDGKKKIDFEWETEPDEDDDDEDDDQSDEEPREPADAASSDEDDKERIRDAQRKRTKQRQDLAPADRPPLDTLVKGDKIIGDVSWLLDIAILGHAKCATSYVNGWLNMLDEVEAFPDEVCDLYDKKPARLVRKLYNELPAGNYKRGFKCPGHFSRPALRYFKDYFTNAKLIVGLRHPVKYFESYYNFRARHLRKGYDGLPTADKLIGECLPEAQGVCTDYAKFHVNLAKLGKTNWTEPDQQKLLNLSERYKYIRPIQNPLFLYDMTQLYDTNERRQQQFKADLQEFLDLREPLPDKEHHVSTRGKAKAMDICHPEYDQLRTELVAIGKRASMWIRKFLIQIDTVQVSSPSFFEEILQTWKYDPCTTNITSMLSP